MQFMKNLLLKMGKLLLVVLLTAILLSIIDILMEEKLKLWSKLSKVFLKIRNFMWILMVPQNKKNKPDININKRFIRT